MSATVRAVVAELVVDAMALTDLASAIAACPTALARLRDGLGLESTAASRYESRAEFGARWNISRAKLDRLIKAGRVTGVRRVDTRVLIPIDAQILPAKSPRRALGRAEERLGLTRRVIG